MPVITQQWHRVRHSVPAVLERLLAMTAEAPAGLAVTADWSVADTLAHLVTIAVKDSALLRGTAPDLPVPRLGELIADTTVDSIALMNAEVLANYQERRIPVLAARLRREVDEIYRLTAHAEPHHTVPWIGGAAMPLSGLLAHLLNEMNLHAWDIAQALRVPWTIDPHDAVLFVDLFLTGVVHSGYGKLLDKERDSSAPGSRISVTFRSRISDPVTFVLDSGVVTVAPADPRPDVRLTFEPVAFSLMLFGRLSRLRAALTGKVRVSGRRPWLLPSFLTTMRMPS